MVSNRRLGDDLEEVQFTRTDRFIVSDEGHFFRTREGVVGPFDDLSSALLGLIDSAKKSGLPQYQINQIYQSACQKVLESVN
ncbi:DUF6316 family protein [Aliikangiella maris]|uniref:DUF6316 family protein n=2 Tax=Aliikangiella maris TaxID=3162458 RepID=A0ABV2BR36_9GAMM